VLAKNFEGNLHLFGGSTATHIEEVSRLAAFKLNDVHSGHGKTSSVHHAANVPIKSDVVQTGGSSLGLVGVGVVTYVAIGVVFDDLGLSESSILVHVDLSIDTVNIEVRGDSPRVDFNLGRINAYKHFVQFLELLNALLTRLSYQLEVVHDLLGQFLVQRGLEGEAESPDSGWVLRSNCLDVHATLLGVNAAEALVLTVVQES